MIRTGIAEKKSGLTESHLNLICKCSGCESSCDRATADIPCKLKNSSLSVWSACNNIHILRVFNGCNGSCCQEKLLPSLLEVDDVYVVASRPYAQRAVLKFAS